MKMKWDVNIVVGDENNNLTNTLLTLPGAICIIQQDFLRLKIFGDLSLWGITFRV